MTRLQSDRHRSDCAVRRFNWTWKKVFLQTYNALGQNLQAIIVRSALTHTHTHTPSCCVFPGSTCSHMFVFSLLDCISTSPLWLPVQTGNSFCSFFSPLHQPLSVSSTVIHLNFLLCWNLHQTHTFLFYFIFFYTQFRRALWSCSAPGCSCPNKSDWWTESDSSFYHQDFCRHMYFPSQSMQSRKINYVFWLLKMVDDKFLLLLFYSFQNIHRQAR